MKLGIFFQFYRDFDPFFFFISTYMCKQIKFANLFRKIRLFSEETFIEIGLSGWRTRSYCKIFFRLFSFCFTCNLSVFVDRQMRTFVRCRRKLNNILNVSIIIVREKKKRRKKETNEKKKLKNTHEKEKRGR